MNLFLTKEVLYLLSYVGLVYPRLYVHAARGLGPGRAFSIFWW